MKGTRIRFLLVSASLMVCATLMLSVNEPDAYTPYTFIYERQTRLSGEYLLAVLDRGDAATLTPALKAIHAELKAGQHDSELDVMRVNLTTLISTAEQLIREQRSADRIPFPEEETAARAATALDQFRSEALEGEDAVIEEERDMEYTPPEHDSVYNEAKKDLLDEAYDMLDTLDSRAK